MITFMESCLDEVLKLLLFFCKKDVPNFSFAYVKEKLLKEGSIYLLTLRKLKKWWPIALMGQASTGRAMRSHS